MTLPNTIDDLFDNANGLILRNVALLINLILKGTRVAILKDHNFEISILETFIALENVRTVKFHHDFRLLLSESFFNAFKLWAFLAFNSS